VNSLGGTSVPISIVLPLIFVGALMSAVGGVFLKLGALRLDGINTIADFWRILTDWQIVVGLGMYFIPAVLWIYMLRKIDLSLLQPLLAIVYIVTPILAIFILKEHVSVMRWAGIAVITVGVVMVARS